MSKGRFGMHGGQYMPETLSEDTPILLEKGSHRIEIAHAAESLEEMELAEETVEVQKETIPAIYEEETEVPINAVYGDEKAPVFITYTSGENGIKETMTLNEKPQSNVFRYKLNTGELRAKKNATNEGITIYDEESEEIVAAISPPYHRPM